MPVQRTKIPARESSAPYRRPVSTTTNGAGNRFSIVNKIKGFFKMPFSTNEPKPEPSFRFENNSVIYTPQKPQLDKREDTPSAQLAQFFSQKGNAPLSSVEYEGVMTLVKKATSAEPEGAQPAVEDAANTTSGELVVLRGDDSIAEGTPVKTPSYAPTFSKYNPSASSRATSRRTTASRRVFDYSGLPSPYRTSISRKSAVHIEKQNKVSKPDSEKKLSSTATALLSILDKPLSIPATMEGEEKPLAQQLANPYASQISQSRKRAAIAASQAKTGQKTAQSSVLSELEKTEPVVEKPLVFAAPTEPVEAAEKPLVFAAPAEPVETAKKPFAAPAEPIETVKKPFAFAAPAKEDKPAQKPFAFAAPTEKPADKTSLFGAPSKSAMITPATPATGDSPANKYKPNKSSSLRVAVCAETPTVTPASQETHHQFDFPSASTASFADESQVKDSEVAQLKLQFVF